MGPSGRVVITVIVTLSFFYAGQVLAWIQHDPNIINLRHRYEISQNRFHKQIKTKPLPIHKLSNRKYSIEASTSSDDFSDPLDIDSNFLESDISLKIESHGTSKTTVGSSAESSSSSASTAWRSASTENRSKSLPNKDVGGYDPSERIGEGIDVGDPQIKVMEKDRSVTSILRELAAIQQQGPQKYCILGTRHCSYLHQQIIELLAYALVLSGNHVYTSGAGGTHAATIRGALRAERPDLLTVVLPQSLSKQTQESQILLKKVEDVIEMPQNNDMSLDVASRICNSYLLSLTDQLISFAFHESSTVIEAVKEAKDLEMLVTVLYLD